MIKPSTVKLPEEPSLTPEEARNQERQTNIKMAQIARIVTTDVPLETAITEAVEAYNKRNQLLISKGTKEAMEVSAPGSLNSKQAKAVLVTLRHHYTNYDELWRSFGGKPGAHEAWQIIKRRTLNSISAKYPELKRHADFEIQNIRRNEKAAAERNYAILAMAPMEARKTIQDALREEIIVGMKSMHQVVVDTLAERNHPGIKTPLEADFKDPKKRSAINRAMIEHLTRKHSNSDELCLKYRGLPGYEYAWDIIYATTLRRIGNIYPKLHMMVDEILRSKRRPWTAHIFPLEWKTASNDVMTFDFRVDNTDMGHLLDVTKEKKPHIKFPSKKELLAVCISNYTNFDDITKVMGVAQHGSAANSSVVDLRVKALGHIAEVHPLFAELIQAKASKLQAKALKLQYANKSKVTGAGTPAFNERLRAWGGDPTNRNDIAKFCYERGLVRGYFHQHPKNVDADKGWNDLPPQQRTELSLSHFRCIYESIISDHPELEGTAKIEWQLKIDKVIRAVERDKQEASPQAA